MKLFSLLLPLLLAVPSLLSAGISVVTTTEDLAALAREVAGDRAAVTSIARGYQDPHFVEAKPSYLLKLKKADLFVQAGLELETAWAPALLTGARNPRILPGRTGFLDASEGCEILQRYAGPVDRSLGDAHPLGNPHYWLDPENGRLIARAVAARLTALDPANAAAYKGNLEAFEAQLDSKMKDWQAAAVSLKGVKAVAYHNSWPSFSRRFGLEMVDFVEPKPGVPPSPAHVRALTARMKAEAVRLLLVEPYFDQKLPRKIAEQAGATLLAFPPSVGAEPGIKTYTDLFDRQFALLGAALEKR